MNPLALTALVGLFYILVFGLLSLVRQERLSNQFAFEGLGITGLAVLAVAAGFSLHPVLLLLILYFITMRARLLVDAGNLFSARGWFSTAITIYNLALRLRPDQIGRLSARINIGVVHLRRGAPEEAAAVLEDALKSTPEDIHPKYEAACRYNLGLAYRRSEQEEKALRQFRHVIEIFPSSIYARGAQTAIREAMNKAAGKAENSARGDQ
ncbi:MAG: tetratricopeptide repeat protein [Anaerolineae bacterium]